MYIIFNIRTVARWLLSLRMLFVLALDGFSFKNDFCPGARWLLNLRMIFVPPIDGF